MAKNTILKIVDVRRLEFGKFWSLVKWLSSLSEFASDVHQISSNPDNFWLSYGALTISKWWTAAILDFWNLQFTSHDLCSACHSASTCKNLLRSDDRLLSSVQKRPTSWILKVLIFGQCITYMSMSSKMSIYYILVYKISSISHNFSLRYGALMIFKMAAVRHVECRNWQWLFSACQYASSYKIKLKRDNRLMNYGKTAIFNLAAVRHFEFKKIFFGELTGIRFNLCSSTQNFIKVGRFLPRDAYA